MFKHPIRDLDDSNLLVMIIEGGCKRYFFSLRPRILVFAWLIGIGKGILVPKNNSGFLKTWLCLGLISFLSFPVVSQNCDIDFPGTSVLDYSTECGGGDSDNLTIGKNVHLGNGDIFTFDAPSVIHIQGNLDINANGSGQIIIPAGVTVIVDGNVQFDSHNNECESGNPCTLTIVVNGYLQIQNVLQNNIVTLAWEGTGTVEVIDKFENTSNGCMECGATCPTFDVNQCEDSGVGCSQNFCNVISNPCAGDIVPPVLSNCPTDITISASSFSCDAVVTWTPPTPSDNCSIGSFTSNHNPGDSFPIGITIVSYQVEDLNNNSTSCSFQVEVIDDTPPVISNFPIDQTVSAIDCENTSVTWVPPSVTDNCITVGFSSSHVPGQIFPLGFTTITYTATDISGNVAAQSFQVEVIDDTDPVFSNCPSDIVIAAPSSDCNAIVNWAPPTVSDNCNVSSVTSSHEPGDSFPYGMSLVTYTATDDNGNTSTCNFLVDVIDSTSPIIYGCPVDISLPASNCTGTLVNWTPPTATDNCNIASFISSHNSGDNFPLGQTTVNYTAADDDGNTVSCSFVVEVLDNVDPVLTGCPTDMTISVGDCATASVNWTPPIASDNCNVASFTSSHNPGEVFNLGITTVNYSAVDDNGNSVSCSFQVELIDDTDPIINNCPADIVVSTSGTSCDAQVTWSPPTASDNCTLLSLTASHQPDDLFPIGITAVTYTAMDMIGNSTSCSFDITVLDQVLPQISNCPADILVPGFDPGGSFATVNWVEPIVIDNCALLEFTSSHKPGVNFPEGQTVVTYSAVDIAGNQQTCNFTIEVRDNHFPAAENVFVQTYSSESVSICFDASDSDGHKLSLGNIEYNRSLGVVDQVDPVQLCFVYTPALGTTGLALVAATICDDRNPVACIDVEAEIEVLSEDIMIYKAFSPNGDGINDLWYIGNIEQHPENSVIIFDRWGSIIFEASGYNNENIVWDGKANSSRISSNGVVPPGTYYFSIKLSGEGSVKGYVELIN